MSRRWGSGEAQSGEDTVITLDEPAKHCYRKLVIADSQIVGAILIGYPRDVPTISTLIKQRADVRVYLDDRRAGNWTVLGTILTQPPLATAT